MNIFGWKARRSAARPVLARGWVPGWTGSAEAGVPADWASRVRAAYADNAVAQRCVRLIAEAVGSAEVGIDGAGAAIASPGASASAFSPDDADASIASPGASASGFSPDDADASIASPGVSASAFSPDDAGASTASPGASASAMTSVRPRGLAARGAAVIALVTARSQGQALMATVASHLLLHGNAYIQVIEGGDGGPGELYALRPDRVVIELDGAGWPVGFAYRVGAETVRLPAEDARGRTCVVHVKLHHPTDDHYGLGCLSAAAGAVVAHNLAGQWNRALLANAARPSGALVYDPGEKGAALSPAQFERLQAEMVTQFSGAGNAGRPLLLEGGLKWQALSLSPADMDFIALKDSAAREIACAFGVPPMLLGVPGDATYANYREATKALWRDSVLPLADTILQGISQGLASWGVAGTLKVDLNAVGALAEDRERLWSMVSAADFLSDAEKRAMVGFG
jgi:HK97 family phage portal protein